MKTHILALDQGTTSSRAIVFDGHGRPVAKAQQEFPQLLPAPGIVEHDPEAIWSSQLHVAQEALKLAQITSADIAAIGVTNQRETTILWEKESGQPVAPAIVWQSRVSEPICRQLQADGCEPLVKQRTGLLLDPYFSGTKIRYLLDQFPKLRPRAERGEILFGTVDSFLIWRLTGGRCHVTDPSNASRTLLFNIHRCEWDDELLHAMRVPRAMLPNVVDSSGVLGVTDADWFGGPIPIAACAGDQQAATFGQACFQPGMAKNTYGTGCFLLLNTGTRPVSSQNQLLTTIGWRIDGEVTYCLEGAVFIGGAVVQWLRDGLQLIKSSSEIESLARSVPDAGGLMFVPAFVGLGAPYWDPQARGILIGITRGTNAGHIARAALEAIAFQTCDLMDALRADSGCELQQLQVDGGASVNDLLMQCQADLLGVTIQRPIVAETTALGVAYLAGLATGIWPNLAAIERNWALGREFHPTLPEDQRLQQLARWRDAVRRSREWQTNVHVR